jgi:hypothetical protein
MKQEFRLVPWCISCAETCPHTLEEIGFSKKGLLARKCFILKKKKKKKNLYKSDIFSLPFICIQSQGYFGICWCGGVCGNRSLPLKGCEMAPFVTALLFHLSLFPPNSNCIF